MSFVEKNALLRRRREAYAAKKMNLLNMACSSAPSTEAPSCKRKQKHYISGIGLDHMETGICFPRPKCQAQVRQKRGEINNGPYNLEVSTSATTTSTTNSMDQPSVFQNVHSLGDLQLTRLFESILNELDSGQSTSTLGTSSNPKRVSASVDPMTFLILEVKCNPFFLKKSFQVSNGFQILPVLHICNEKSS